MPQQSQAPDVTIGLVGFFLLFLAAAGSLIAQTGENVLLVVNRNDPASRQIGDYYRVRRGIPRANICELATTSDEEIDWKTYEDQIERHISECLTRAHLKEKVLYLVTTMGVPLRIQGTGAGFHSLRASVDSELTLLYGKLKGQKFGREGAVANPFFMKRDAPFQHSTFPIYLVTRLAAYDVADVKAMIDRSLAARNRGRFLLDLKSASDEMGNDWLRTAALLLPPKRVLLEESNRVLENEKDVIGYASWGSNDLNHSKRFLHFQWLPGAIATEYVSTNGRTFKRPPDAWNLTSWSDHAHFFAGSPQSLSADLIHEGATGASGNVYEPYLTACVRPDYLFPAYVQGRNLAESYYLGLMYLSWQGIILGDPLCSLGKP